MMKSNNEVLEFCKEHGLTEDQFYGRKWVRGILNLSKVKSVPNGFGVKVIGHLILGSLTALPSGTSLTTSGHLYLNSLRSLTKGTTLSSGGSMYLGSLTSLSEGVILSVGGYCELCSLTSLPKGIEISSGGAMTLCSLTSLPAGVSLIAGGHLGLRSLVCLSSGVKLLSGGHLELKSLTTLPEGVELLGVFSVQLGSLKTLPSDFNPLCGQLILPKDVKLKAFKILHDEVFEYKDKKYIRHDGVFGEVISKSGNIYKVKKLGHKNASYLVTDGNKWAYGDTLKEARDSLAFSNANCDLSKFEGYTLETELSLVDAMICYHGITGEHEFGIKSFIKPYSVKYKTYKISDIIELSSGHYGHDLFSDFFKQKRN